MNEYDAISGVSSVLEYLLKVKEESRAPYTDEEVTLAGEALKILFNVTLTLDDAALQREEVNLVTLSNQVNNLFVVDAEDDEMRKQLRS